MSDRDLIAAGRELAEATAESPEVAKARNNALSEALELCGHLQLEMAQVRSELQLIREDRVHLHEMLKLFAHLLSTASQQMLEKEIHRQIEDYEQEQKRRRAQRWAS